VSNGSEVATQLSPELTSFLQGPQLVLVTTLDSDSKWPTNNLITWVFARDGSTVRLAADSKGRVMGNIRADERVLLTVMTNGACHCVEGTAKVIVDEIPGVSLKLACAEVTVKAVRDVTFWGGKITAEPQYDVTYDKALKQKLDAAVFDAFKSL